LFDLYAIAIATSSAADLAADESAIANVVSQADALVPDQAT